MKTLLIGNGFTRRYSEDFTYAMLYNRLMQWEPRDEKNRKLLVDIRRILNDNRYFWGSDFEKAIEYLEFIQDFLIKRISEDSNESIENFKNEINNCFTKLVREADEKIVNQMKQKIDAYDNLLIDVSVITTLFDEVYTLNFDSLYSKAVENLNMHFTYVGEIKDVNYMHFDDKSNAYVIGSIGEKKYSFINSVNRLKETFDRFKNIKGELHILGCSLDKSDNHLIKAIKENEKITKVVFYLYSEDSGEKLNYQKGNVKYNIFNDKLGEKLIINDVIEFDKLLENQIDFNKNAFKRRFHYTNTPTVDQEVSEYIVISRNSLSVLKLGYYAAVKMKHSLFISIKSNKEKALYHILKQINTNKYRTGSVIGRIDYEYLFKDIRTKLSSKIDDIHLNLLNAIEKKLELLDKKIMLQDVYAKALFKKTNKVKIKNKLIYTNSINSFRNNFYLVDKLYKNSDDQRVIILKQRNMLNQHIFLNVRQFHKGIIQKYLYN